MMQSSHGFPAHVGFSRYAHFKEPISCKPEIGGCAVFSSPSIILDSPIGFHFRCWDEA
jgi:hypothetical protein